MSQTQFDNNIPDENGEAAQADDDVKIYNKARHVHTIKIMAHCSDRFGIQGKDSNGKVLFDRDSCYVPNGIGIGGGDDVELEINIETGQIVGWTKPAIFSLVEALKDE